MATKISVGPVTRIEGHLDIDTEVDLVNSQQRVVKAASSGTMFRGFEEVLKNRDPRDAGHLTQRICGVCPVAHGVTAAVTLEAALKQAPQTNGRVARNLILGSNFIQSHILHFYHLAMLDYVSTMGSGIDAAPWSQPYLTPDMLTGADASRMVSSYLQALEYRRKAHQMGAVFGGKLPHTPTIVATGNTDVITTAKINALKTLLNDILNFIVTVYVPDVEFLAQKFPSYYQIGRGCGNLLAFGVFDLDNAGTRKLLKRGRYTDGQYNTVDPTKITEYVKYSKYTDACGNLNPAGGQTVPQPTKTGAYSWIKAPRYLGKVHEVGPLARMWINGDYRRGISVMDRLMARALECRKVAEAMQSWINSLTTSGSTHRFTSLNMPTAATSGIGLSEAARGALGHWLTIQNGVVTRYQIITPTAWNASPMDDQGQRGAMEQALMGTPVADPTRPIELLRVVHSFDPCLACSVHTLRAGHESGQVMLRAAQ